MKTLLCFLSTSFFLVCTLVNAAPNKEEWENLAREGDLKSIISLGLMYHTGNGVEVDLKKALNWYLLGYVKNDGDALNNIGVMFRDGSGVVKNEKIAYLLFLGVHMEGLGTQATQARANRNLRRLAQTLQKEDLYEALSYTWNYVDQVVKSRGNNTIVDKAVLPTKSHPRIRDNSWWLESERKGMDFKSPPPWDKIPAEDDVEKTALSPESKPESREK